MSGLFARLADVVLNPKTGWKTTHFWGPVANWGISGAAIYDMQFKELDVVSLPMTGTLAVYSMFFMRFAWAVDPRNYILFACHTTNVCAQLTQMTRKLKYDGYLDPAEISVSKVVEKVKTDEKAQRYAALGACGLGGFLASSQIQRAVTSVLPMPQTVRNVLLHPAGPFTIFFWAPTFKWSLSGSNIVEYKRPVEKISTQQQVALFATGVIWTRWSFVINPVNVNLAVVNGALALTSGYHLGRKYIHDPFKEENDAAAAAASSKTS
jgi:hypothetical protein